jgi:hypothetical protein
MEATCCSGTSIDIYRTTRRYIPEILIYSWFTRSSKCLFLSSSEVMFVICAFVWDLVRRKIVCGKNLPWSRTCEWIIYVVMVTTLTKLQRMRITQLIKKFPDFKEEKINHPVNQDQSRADLHQFALLLPHPFLCTLFSNARLCVSETFRFVSHFRHACYMYHPFHSSWFHDAQNITWKVQITKFSWDLRLSRRSLRRLLSSGTGRRVLWQIFTSV